MKVPEHFWRGFRNGIYLGGFIGGFLTIVAGGVAEILNNPHALLLQYCGTAVFITGALCWAHNPEKTKP